MDGLRRDQSLSNASFPFLINRENRRRRIEVEPIARHPPLGLPPLHRLQVMIDEELTEKQCDAMIAVAIKRMPLEEVARCMGSNRNALHKLIYDARLNLKRRLAQEGLHPEDLLSVFEIK